MKRRSPRSDFASTGENILEGRAVSRGVAAGRVLILYGASRQFHRTEIPKNKIAAEIERFRSAVRVVRGQLAALAAGSGSKSGNSASEIFEAHLLILNEASLCPAIEDKIREKRSNAEWAVRAVIDELSRKYKKIPDPTIRERYIDLEDVGERLFFALGGVDAGSLNIAKGSVIVADELRPSTLVQLARFKPAAVITENGGWTSHTFIIGRELEIPAVTGVSHITSRVRDGDRVLVDGFSGRVVIEPSKDTLKRLAVDAAHWRRPRADYAGSKTTATLEGAEIIILANSDSPAAWSEAKRFGARGIGLYRSEKLIGNKGIPTEAEQTRAYTAIARAAKTGGVKIRTFDIGGDRFPDSAARREKNPALGLRAIRFGLAHPKYLRTQLRALIAASAGQNLDIIIPMVSGVADIIDVQKLLKREANALAKSGTAIGSPRLGAMIEVPAAVFTIDQILEHVDFVCLGTNDLVQYMLATDRDNESAAKWFTTLHPAVLIAIKKVASAAMSSGKELIVCGEMAASPFYVPILLGLGVRQLSMNANAITRVRNFISRIALDECKQLAAAALACATAADVEKHIKTHMQAKWSGLFPDSV